MRSRSDRAMLVRSSHEEGRECGLWLPVRILNSLVFGLRTTVRATRAFFHQREDYWRDHQHVHRGGNHSAA
jgi:hypothetical protein